MNKIIFSLIMSLIMTSFCAAQPVSGNSIDVVSITASSTLPDNSSVTNPKLQKKIRYSADKAIDGRQDTVWSEGRLGPGINEYIIITFEKSILIDEVEIMTGYFDANLFAANNRIRKFRIEGDVEGWSQVFSCEDRQIVQKFPLNKTLSTNAVALSILDVYKGNRWDDTCLSELGLYYKGKKYNLLCNRVNYQNGKYSLEIEKNNCEILIKDSMDSSPSTSLALGSIPGGSTVTGELFPGSQVGARILDGSGTWSFNNDGTLIIEYSYYKMEKRMGPEEDNSPPEEIHNYLKLMIAGGVPEDEEVWFENSSDFLCIILEGDLYGSGR